MKGPLILILLSAFWFFAGAVIPTRAADAAGAIASPNLSGVVSSSTGAPVTNASVFIYTAGPRQGAGVVCPACYADCHKSTNSDTSGKFEIRSLSPALLFRVLVVAQGYEPTFFDKVDPLKSPLDARLKPRLSTNIPPGQIISGRVVNARKEQLANVVVSVDTTQIGDTGYGYTPEGVDPLAVTDDHGEFAVQSMVKFDSMDLRVEARGYASQNLPQVHPGMKPLECVMTEGAALTGQLLWNGKPLANVSIGVAGTDRSMGNFTGDFIYGTDENGRFLFVNLPPNRDYALYGLMDSLHPYGALPVRTVHAGTDDSLTDVGILQVVPGHRLAGQVKLSDGKPVPEHTHLFIGRESAWDTSTVIELPSDGRFDFTNVPAEAIALDSSVKGYRFSQRNVSLDRLNPFGLVGRLDSDKTNLILLLEPGNPEPDYSRVPDEERPENLPLAGAEGTRVIPDGVTISGRAFDSETKTPVSSFRVIPGTLRNPNRPESGEWYKSLAVNGTNGNFDLTLSVKKRAIVLMAEADGYLPIQSEPLKAGQTNYDFQLHKGSGPSGVVRQLDGRPAAGATVIYIAGGQQGGLDEAGRLQTYSQGGEKVPADAGGRFLFAPQLGTGKIFAADSNGFGRIIPEALQKNGVVILQPWARVHGRLLKDGNPVAGENLDLFWGADNSQGWPRLNLHGAVTGQDGRFVIDFVPPGDMSISTRNYMGSDHSGWSDQSLRNFTAKPGEDVDLSDVTKVDPKE